MRRSFALLLVVVLLAGGYAAWVLSRPLPVLQPRDILATLPAENAISLPWPAYGQAAVGAPGYGVLAIHSAQTAVPTASVAKILTALAVLQKYPLKLGGQGPSLTMGDQDITFYQNYVAEGGSVVPINSGEQISEYQALQAMLLPSANNMAESLAYWAFGSMPAYTSFANAYALQLGLTHTHVADASGFSPATVSTAADLVLLGEAAMQNPVLAQIVGQAQADVPVAGTIQNVNELLGQNGINGIKTGNTDQAGGVFLASGTYTVAGGHTVTIVAAIMGAPDLWRAMHDSLSLMAAAPTGFAERTVVHSGEIVGYYNTPWHTSGNAVAAHDITSFGWKGRQPQLKLSLQPLHSPAPKGQAIGTLTLNNGPASQLRAAVTLQQAIPAPSWQWRLMHP